MFSQYIIIYKLSFSYISLPSPILLNNDDFLANPILYLWNRHIRLVTAIQLLEVNIIVPADIYNKLPLRIPISILFQYIV